MSCPPLAATIANHADLVGLRQRWEALDPVPVLIERRDEAIDHSWGGLDIRTFLRGEQSASRFAVHDIGIEPGAGLPVHYQEDCFAYLLLRRGRLTVQVGEVSQSLGENGFAFIPPRTHFAFRNESGAPCSIILVYSPAGAERAFEDAHAHWHATGERELATYRPILEAYGFRFDGRPLENDRKTNEPITPIVGDIRSVGDLERLREAFNSRPALPRIVDIAEEEIEKVTRDGATFRRSVLTGDDSGGQAMVHVLSGAPGMSAEGHYQPTEEEMFFIGRGGLDMTCGTQQKLLEDGAFAFCPRNCTHGFSNPNLADHSRFITINSPAGHERALAAFRALAAAGAPREEFLAVGEAGGFILRAGAQP